AHLPPFKRTIDNFPEWGVPVPKKLNLFLENKMTAGSEPMKLIETALSNKERMRYWNLLLQFQGLEDINSYLFASKKKEIQSEIWQLNHALLNVAKTKPYQGTFYAIGRFAPVDVITLLTHGKQKWFSPTFFYGYPD